MITVVKKIGILLDVEDFSKIGDFRVSVQKVSRNRGVRWKNVDICKTCFVDYLNKLLSKIEE